jgi:S-formylglutathione hydrolase
VAGYLGADTESWKDYDSTRLLHSGVGAGRFDDILIDVGTGDKFYQEGQLLPEVSATDAICDVNNNIVFVM